MRESLAIRIKLLASDARNADWQGATAASYDDIGDCFLGLQNDRAIDSYQHGLQIREQLAEDNPDIPRWQAFLAVSLYNLGRAGDNPQERYKRALDLLYKLAVSGKLPDRVRALPAEIERRLKDIADK